MNPEEILATARQNRVFSGAAWSYGTSAGPVGGDVLGTLSWSGANVDADTWWDLASVTKPIVGLAVMTLVEDGALLLNDTVGQWLPTFRDSDKAVLTIRQLLTHTSGIPGQIPLYRWATTADHLVDAIRYVPVACPPDTRVIYSSQGFILLGRIAEAAAGIGLDQLVADRVTGPVAMTATRFGLPPQHRDRAAATEDCPWRGHVVQGTVHDENAEVLGGVAGHAGLFAPVADVAALAQRLCRGAEGVLSPAGHAEMIRPATDHLALRRALAWQGRDPVGCPAGDLFGPRAYGHTGFTGTSLWVDPDRDCYVVLLTNRVHPSRVPQDFPRVRAAFHNAAVAATVRTGSRGTSTTQSTATPATDTHLATPGTDRMSRSRSSG
jgi:CubicO group peptidase (beta-lactamase class C family)